MKIYIGADHNGFAMKKELLNQLTTAGYEVIDKGNKNRNPEDDYPQFAAQVVHAMKASNDPETRGILICGSGQGICIAANRFKGIRACLVDSAEEARAARNDDDSNILCLPARYMKIQEALRLTEVWLSASFAGAPRFKRRIRDLDNLS